MRKLPKNLGVKPIVALRPLRPLRLKTLVRKEQATNGSGVRQAPENEGCELRLAALF